MKQVSLFTFAILILLVIAGCADKDKAGNLLDAPTAGSVKIAVDESLRPLMDAEVKAFAGIYKNANIDVHYCSEREAMDALLTDSVRLIVLTRRMTDEESQAILAQKIVPHEVAIAKEGVALILNRDNRDSLIHTDQLKGFLHGEPSPWKSAGNGIGSFRELVFDNPASGIVRFLRDSVVTFDTLPPYCFAVNSNPEVVDYVSKKRTAIGLIGVSWISDKDDSTANQFLSTVKVAAVSNGAGFYQPYQAYIAQGHYPLVREVIMISREARAGLASGFMAFVASDKGQRVVLKAGLVPATMPLRIVEINRDPL